VSTTSATVKQSRTSAKSTFYEVIPAILNAASAAIFVPGIVVRCSRPCNAAGEPPRPEPNTFT